MASTRLKIFESADTNDNKGDIVNELMKYINSTQAPEEKKKKKNDQGRLANRRMTIKDLQDAHLDKKEKGDFINLEKQFKDQVKKKKSDGKMVSSSGIVMN